MKITLNFNPEVYEAEQMTISEILKAKNYTYRELIIRINGTLIRHENWDEIIVRDGDNVEIIHIFHGG